MSATATPEKSASNATNAAQMVETQREMLDFVRDLVNIESYATQVDGSTRSATCCATRWGARLRNRTRARRAARAGAQVARGIHAARLRPHAARLPARRAVERRRPRACADPRRSRHGVRSGQGLPFSIDGDRALGPGIADMKGGLTVAVYALKALQATGLNNLKRSRACSAPMSRAAASMRASRSRMRPRIRTGCSAWNAREGGKLMGSRAQIGVAKLEVFGRDAHAGSAYAKGISAIEAMARKVQAIHALTDPSREIYLCVGQISGGWRRSVIPGYCMCTIDIRTPGPDVGRSRVEAARDRGDRRAAGLAFEVPDRLAPARRPVDAKTDKLIGIAKEAGAEFGLDFGVLRSPAAGSSAFVGPMDLPCLDGMGPMGGDLMTTNEHIVISSMVDRATCLRRRCTSSGQGRGTRLDEDRHDRRSNEEDPRLDAGARVRADRIPAAARRYRQRDRAARRRRDGRTLDGRHDARHRLRRHAARSCAAAGAMDLRRVHGRSRRRGIAPAVECRLRGGTGKGRLLMMGHIDTAFPVGAPATNPFRIDPATKRAYGPAVADMKGGDAGIVFACRALVETGVARPEQITVIFDTDEQGGSVRSRPLIEAEARQSDWGLVTEAGRVGGEAVGQRAGIAIGEIIIDGVEAHLGTGCTGRSAIEAMCRKVIALHKLHDPDNGVLLNVGEFNGGTRRNLYAGRCVARMDIRCVDMAAWERTKASIEAIAAANDLPGTTTTLKLQQHRPPMPWTPETRRMAELVRETGAAIGANIDTIATMGGSDANIIASQGVPTQRTRTGRRRDHDARRVHRAADAGGAGGAGRRVGAQARNRRSRCVNMDDARLKKIGETRALAEFALNLKLDDCPPDVIHQAKRCTIETPACALGGSRTPLVRTALNCDGADGRCARERHSDDRRRRQALRRIVRRSSTASPRMRSTTAASCCRVTTAARIFATLAMAELTKCSGREFVEAVIAAYEVTTRIGEATRPTPEYRRQVSGYGPHQGFAAVVAAGRLLKLDVDRMVHAFGIYGTFAPLPSSAQWNWRTVR